MKYIFIGILTLLLFRSSELQAGHPADLSLNEISDKIADAIRAGDASRLASSFAPTIHLSVPGKKGDFSKTQAEVIMRDFFNQYPPTSFSVNSEGKTSGTNYYTLGVYTSGSVQFKTYYVIQKSDSDITLHILKFEIQ